MRTATGCALAALAGAAAIGLAGCSSSGTAAPAIAVTTPAQLPTAAQVAQRVGATGFVNDTGKTIAQVVTSGTASYHGRKIGIDTFASQDARDSWLQMAGVVAGVTPLLEGPTWVVYWSVSSA